MNTIVILLLVSMASASIGYRRQNKFPIRTLPNHKHPDYNKYPNYKRTALGDSVDIASMKILKEIYEASDDKNILVSPLGVLSLLSLYASGCEGETRDEIMKLLNSTDYKQLSESYGELSERFALIDKSSLSLASKVFISNKYSLNDDFYNTARSYRSEVDNIDFADQTSAAQAINDWASKHTQGKINHPVAESDIDPAETLALLNVIFFQGHWHVPFNASKTEEKDFYTAKAKSVKKPMMHLLRSLYYHEDKDLGAKMIELPYKESKFRMIVILPDEIEDLPKVVKKVSEKGLLDDVFKMYPAGTDVILDMPKFEIKSKHDLNDILPKVGVSNIFDKEARGIVKETGVKVDKAFQEAFVTVDEEGATAGAFTGQFAVPMSAMFRPPPPILFKVDRPFLFAILHDDIILFVGTYSH